MSQSKLVSFDPIFGLGRSYNQALRRNPLLVKSLTSCVLGALGNYLAQVASRPSTPAPNRDRDRAGQQPKPGAGQFINRRSILAFAVLGLGLYGPAVHFWLNFLERHGPSHPALKLILDRFGFGPIILLVTLFLLPLLEGSSKADAVAQVKKTYWNALKMNWKVWILVQYVNLNFVPLQYRVLVTNLVSIGWNIYLSKARARSQQLELEQQKKREIEQEKSSGASKSNEDEGDKFMMTED